MTTKTKATKTEAVLRKCVQAALELDTAVQVFLFLGDDEATRDHLNKMRRKFLKAVEGRPELFSGGGRAA